jgi:hypothetical protein
LCDETEEFIQGKELPRFSRDDMLDPAGNLSGARIGARVKPDDERAMDRKCVWPSYLCVHFFSSSAFERVV